MALPLRPPLLPQLAKSQKTLPQGDGWVYEPKWDGFRSIAFVDGDSVHLQSRNGKPLTRYFPELKFPEGRYILDGEIVCFDDQGRQDFDALGQRIHPAKSRIDMLAEETPTRFIAFDLLAIDDESLLELPQRERRDRLEQLVEKPVDLTPASEDPREAQPWLQGAEGVVAKRQDAPYRPGERVGMVKIKRVRTIDAVVRGWRPGKEEGTLGSLSLALYDAEGSLREVGHTSGFTAKQKRELPAFLAPYETGERFSAEPSRWNAARDMDGAVVRPELVVEVTFDHTSNERIRHGAKLVRWRDDKPPRQCTMDQLDS
jgi:ATP-dependent DNA ligase